jgi:membrane associated rhomboid family serine protease
MRHTARAIMVGQSDSNDYQPFGYIGRVPLYFSTILVIVYAVCGVGLVLWEAFAGAHAVNIEVLLSYDSASIHDGYQFWRFFTYALVNQISIWFVLELYLLYSFGREVERFIGRTAYGMLYGSLVALAPCICTALSTIYPKMLIGFAGASTVDFAVFIAFATVYPNVEIFFRFQAKWVAAVLIAVFSLQQLHDHAMLDLLLFWAACLAAFLFIKYLRGQIQFSLRDYFRQRRSRQVLKPLPRPKPVARALPPKSERDDVIESIDPLLDKIATHGIASLTASERAKLEEARAELLKKPAQ